MALKRSSDLGAVPLQELAGELARRSQQVLAQQEELAEQRRDLQAHEERVAKRTRTMADASEVLSINAGGQVFSVQRSTLALAEGSALTALFSGKWEEGMARDSEGRPFLEVDPYIFGKILNYLRQKRIETPGLPAPLPSIDPEKKAEFRAVAKFYMLEELLTPTTFLLLSRPGTPTLRNDDIMRGYELSFSRPFRLQAVSLGLEGVLTDTVVCVRNGGRQHERPLVALGTEGSAWKAQDPQLTCCADGFGVELAPPTAYIFVKGDAASMKYKCIAGDFSARSVGSLSVASKAWQPASFFMQDNVYSISMCLGIKDPETGDL